MLHAMTGANRAVFTAGSCSIAARGEDQASRQTMTCDHGETALEPVNAGSCPSASTRTPRRHLHGMDRPDPPTP
jgi:hypothetical protein